MSDSSETAAQYASQTYNLYLEGWMATSVMALTIYEYIITFEGEITSVWRRKKTVPVILLLMLRWAMVILAISNILNAKTPWRCEAEAITESLLIVFMNVLTAALSGLRVYALWGRNRALFFIIFILSVPGIGIQLHSLDGVFVTDPIFGCFEEPNYDLKQQAVYLQIYRIPIIVGAALVIGATWIKSYRQIHEGRRLGISVSLSTLLLRDGTAYFLIMLVMNILELCPNLPNGGQFIGALNPCLAPILLNRLMLNLKQLSDEEAASRGQVHDISTPMFRVSVNVVGNMGESLEFGREDADVLDGDDSSPEHAEISPKQVDSPSSEGERLGA